MTYQEAERKSLQVKWKVSYCSQGDICWCRTIEPIEPIMFKECDLDIEEEFLVVRDGAIVKDTAEHIVMIHNQFIDSQTKQ